MSFYSHVCSVGIDGSLATSMSAIIPDNNGVGSREMRHQVLPKKGAYAHTITANDPRSVANGTPIQIDIVRRDRVPTVYSGSILGPAGPVNDMVRVIIHDRQGIVDEPNCRLLKGMLAEETI